MKAKKLTPRETDVVRLVVKGQTYQQIAVSLGLRYESVKTYLERIRKKLGVTNKVAIALWGVRHLGEDDGRVESDKH